MLPSLLAVSVAHAQVTWRGGCDPGPDFRATALTPQGVRVESASLGNRVVAWDAVASVAGPLAETWPLYQPLAEQAWRGRSRLERGDTIGAEVILDELFAKHASEPGPTTARLARGMLYCRLTRGALTQSVHPFLALTRCGPAPALVTSAAPDEVSAELLFDDAWGLSPLLAPIWLRLPAVQGLARGQWPAADASRSGQIAALYAASAKVEVGVPVTLGPRPSADAPLELLYDVVASRAGDAAQIAAARTSLQARLSQPASTDPEWVRVWCRAALGRSLALDTDADTRWQGVAELLAVPAASERAQPYLTGVCLAQAAVTLSSLGDGRGASRLASELRERFPGHPALQWDDLVRIPSHAPASSAAPSTDLPSLPAPVDAPGGSTPNGDPR